MRLLLYTQAIDKNDPLLGFFHRLTEELSKYFEEIHVVCLKAGVYALPKNVQVFSLGKEDGESLIKYVVRFYQHLYHLRGSYDRVFVHMNPHYVLLGGWYWKMKHIPIFFWRNHARMNLMTQIAARFAKRVFYTSPYACTSRYAHAMQMPVGIDVLNFYPKKSDPHTQVKVLFLGRLSPVKRVEMFITASNFLPDGFEMHIYGDAPKNDTSYATKLKGLTSKNVTFHPSITNDATPDIYRSHDIYVNLTPEGSMDKTVLEATACGIQTVATNKSFIGTIDESSLLTEQTPEALAEKIIAIATLSQEEREQRALRAREAVVQNHSLTKLAEMLRVTMK